MTFKLACGDVLPGCAAHFETGSRDQLMTQVAAHAAAVHGIVDFTPEVAELVSSQILIAN